VTGGAGTTGALAVWLLTGGLAATASAGAHPMAIGAAVTADEAAREESMNEKATLSLSEFGSGEAPAWRSVNDVVMGGRSASRLSVTADGTGRFEGTVSLENNGGFASVRRMVGPVDLGDFAGVALRVRGDGRRYRVRLRTDERYDGIAWQASFDTRPDVWAVVTLPFGAFEPSFRGRRPAGAGPLDTRRITQLGLMIADRQAGDFKLEIDWIRALRASAPEAP
jgi:monofunctional biosynthetic peptidoglycan transglycosylase